MDEVGDFMKDVLEKFDFYGEVVACNPYGNGHINSTHMVTTNKNKRYILQKINKNIFKDVPGLMNNIISVTEHIEKKIEKNKKVLTLLPTKSGEKYLFQDGDYYRVYDYIENSICLQLPEGLKDFYESAVAFGEFTESLADFQVDRLVEVIPNFHNTKDRYRIFEEVLERDEYNRAASVKAEIEFLLSRKEEMGTLENLRKQGKIKERVTHNDTKLNNVLLDINTRKALCVIDLDTVMPGLSLYDFGDSIRFGASTAEEDEKDLKKVDINLEMFRTYTRGYVGACRDLTELEIDNLPMGAKTMTLECGLRFLTDYLNGDKYFSIHREEHNLDRARTQLRLVERMEDVFEKMKHIVAEEVEALKG